LSGDDQSQLPVLFLGLRQLPLQPVLLVADLLGRVGLGASLAGFHTASNLLLQVTAPDGHLGGVQALPADNPTDRAALLPGLVDLLEDPELILWSVLAALGLVVHALARTKG